MLYKILLPPVLTTLTLLTLLAQPVLAASSGYGTVQITGVNAPATVGAGQTAAVSITVSYLLTQPLAPEGLIIALMPQTEVGNPYPILSVSNNCQAPSNQSLCVASLTPQQFFTRNSITVSFTLKTPSTPETWQPSACALIVVWNSTSPGYTTEQSVHQTVTINVTGQPVPETPSILGLLLPALLLGFYISKRKAIQEA